MVNVQINEEINVEGEYLPRDKIVNFAQALLRLSIPVFRGNSPSLLWIELMSVYWGYISGNVLPRPVAPHVQPAKGNIRH